MAPSALRPALFIARLVTANTETVLSKALCRLALNALAWPSKGPPSSHPTRPLPCPSVRPVCPPCLLPRGMGGALVRRPAVRARGWHRHSGVRETRTQHTSRHSDHKFLNRSTIVNSKIAVPSGLTPFPPLL